MSANAFITNAQSHTLKKRLEELIQHSKELEPKTSEVSETSEVWKIDEQVKSLYGL
jgi:hypothetical protein